MIALPIISSLSMVLFSVVQETSSCVWSTWTAGGPPSRLPPSMMSDEVLVLSTAYQEISDRYV